ncbi:MAG: adenylate/guanylate cyclase domain-containing protein [Candidatus Villigracilaceae bacterium]
MPEKTKPQELHDLLLVLSQQAGRLRTQLQSVPGVSSQHIQALRAMESSLYRLSRETATFVEERQNLLGLTETSQAINSSLELDEVLRIVMDTIISLTGAERGFLMLKDEKGEMNVRIARNWEQESINPNEVVVSRSVVQRVITDGQPVLTTNAQEDPRFGGQESVVAYNLRSILCVPLKVKGTLIGVIYADNRIREGIFRETECDLLTAFANQAATAIENARLFSSLRRTLAEVTELKNLMDNVLASIASGVMTADVHDQITLCNRAARAILGREAIEIVGRRLDEVLPDFATQILPHLAMVRQSDKPIVGLEISHNQNKRGAVEWRLSLSPLKNANQETQGVAIVLDDLTEHRKLEAQRRLLERMVSPAVLEQIDPDSMHIGGQQVEITVLFADVRGFTAYAEQHSPVQLVTVLNRYLAAGAEAVLAQEGTVDKFLGDAVMAWFNAPLPQPDHTLRAVRAALGLLEAVQHLHEKLPPEARLSFGVGIHCGNAILGWIGTQKRLDYTAIGDSVNTAKRIQENAAKNQILISADAYLRVKDEVLAVPYAPLRVKGKTEPVIVYEVKGLK